MASKLDFVRMQREAAIRTCDDLRSRIAALERQVKAADALAEFLDLPDQSDGLFGRYHYDWHKVDTALAAYQATKEQSK